MVVLISSVELSFRCRLFKLTLVVVLQWIGKPRIGNESRREVEIRQILSVCLRSRSRERRSIEVLIVEVWKVQNARVLFDREVLVPFVLQVVSM